MIFVGVVCHQDSLAASCTESFPRKVEAHIPEPLHPALAPLLTTISDLTQRIRAIERAVAITCEHDYSETRLLRQVPGLGPITALAFVLVVEDPTRFAKSREIGPYLGLVPRRRQSGRSAPQLRITKAGDRQLRRLLVGCAQYILDPFGPHCDLRRWGLARAPVGRGSEPQAHHRGGRAPARHDAPSPVGEWRGLRPAASGDSSPGRVSRRSGSINAASRG